MMPSSASRKQFRLQPAPPPPSQDIVLTADSHSSANTKRAADGVDSAGDWEIGRDGVTTAVARLAAVGNKLTDMLIPKAGTHPPDGITRAPEVSGVERRAQLQTKLVVIFVTLWVVCCVCACACCGRKRSRIGRLPPPVPRRQRIRAIPVPVVEEEGW
eukprot:scaffold209459_cov31-Tisochrysis_lutea.AAC.1